MKYGQKRSPKQKTFIFKMKSNSKGETKNQRDVYMNSHDIFSLSLEQTGKVQIFLRSHIHH